MVIAKFKVDSIESPEGFPEAKVVRMSPVYSPDPLHPNHTWSKATPAGQLVMTISNPQAQPFFKQGDELLLTFTKAGA